MQGEEQRDEPTNRLKRFCSIRGILLDEVKKNPRLKKFIIVVLLFYFIYKIETSV